MPIEDQRGEVKRVKQLLLRWRLVGSSRVRLFRKHAYLQAILAPWRSKHLFNSTFPFFTGGPAGVRHTTTTMIPGYARWGFTAFFSTHFFISLLLDAQALSIGDNFPELLKSIMQVSTAVPPYMDGVIYCGCKCMRLPISCTLS